MTRSRLAALALTLFACGPAPGPSGSGGGGGTTQTGGGSGGGSAATGGGGGTATHSWPGTWVAQLDYEAACNFASSAFQRRTHSHAVTVQVAQQGSGFSAQSLSNYEMTGTGSATRLDLNGTFPLLDHNGNRAGSSNNTMVTIVLDTVESASAASGRVSGQFDGSSGFQCEVTNGTVRFTR